MDIMKRWLPFVLLIMVCGVFAVPPKALFEQGNHLYQQGQYEQAAQKYREILKQGFESGELYFNLGNVYYKLNQPGLARLYYERAKKFLKNDEALHTNLQLLSMRLVDKIQQPPQFILTRWWRAVLDLFNLTLISWLTLGLLLLTLFSGAVRLYFVRRKKGNRFKELFVTAVVLFLIAVFILGQKIYRLESEHFAVILSPTVTLYAEPNSSGTEVFVLHEGTKVQIRRRNQNWLEIRLSDGKTGWLQKDDVETI